MCLFLKNKESKIAEENILVFKVVRISNKKINSYFQDMPYHKGFLYKSEIKVTDDHYFGPYKHTIEKALHSYDLRIYQDYYVFESKNWMFNIGNSPNEESYTEDNTNIGLFVIPKGSTYYKSDYCYASDKLICLDKFFTLEEWYNKRSFIIEFGGKTLTSNAYINDLRLKQNLCVLT